MQKLILVYSDEFEELNSLLKDGWKIISISATASTEDASHCCYCYVLLEK